MIKKITSLILCLIMIFSISLSVFAAQRKTINYVSLGSSQSLGYGFEEYYPEQMKNWTGTTLEKQLWEARGWDAPTWDPSAIRYLSYADTGYNNFGIDMDIEGSFSNLVKESFISRGYNVNFKQLAASAYRANDLLWLLYDDCIIDEYAELQYIGKDQMSGQYLGLCDKESAIAEMKSIYQEALKNADVITYDLGSGNFGLTIIAALYYDCGCDIAGLMDSKYRELYSYIKENIETEIDNILRARNINPEDLESYEFLLEEVSNCVVSYCISLDRTMEWIYTNNPDAEVVVMQIQNLTSGLIFSYNGVTLPYGEILQVLINMTNTYASTLSKYAGKYYYARFTDDQRAETFLDQLLDYQGPEDITKDLTTIVDVYSGLSLDLDMHVKSNLTPIYEELGHSVGDASYDSVLIACYDSYFKFLKYLFANDDPQIKTVGAELDYQHVYNDISINLLSNTTADILSGKSNEIAISNAINAFDNLDDFTRANIKLYIYLSLAQTALLHPNRNGAKTMADAAINALDNKITGPVSIIEGAKNSKKDKIVNTQKLTNFFVSSAVTKLKDDVKKLVVTAKDMISNTNPINTVFSIFKAY